ncbi:MAG: hypothetical protein Q8K75_05705 [Chlamydiales bacterium]|nr:hypothetical protein [Chlamydiales bacterium]
MLEPQNYSSSPLSSGNNENIHSVESDNAQEVSNKDLRTSKESQPALKSLAGSLTQMKKDVGIGLTEFFSHAGDAMSRIRSAVGRVLPFVKPPRTDEQQHAKALSIGKKHGAEAGFKRDPSLKAFHKDPRVMEFKQLAKEFCKDQFRMEGGTSKDMAHHEQWTSIKKAAQKGDFEPLAKELKSNPDLMTEMKAKDPQYQNKLNICNTKYHEALHKFSGLVDRSSSEDIMKPGVEKPTLGKTESDYDKETFLTPDSRVQVNQLGAIDLGCTKSPDDLDYSSKGTTYCQDRAGIQAFDGGVAVCGCDGVSGAKDSEVIAKMATTKLNQRLADHADTLRGLYQQGKTGEIELYVRGLFTQVQKEIYEELDGQQIKAATTAVVFVKIDLPGEDHSLVIGGSIGDCCATMTTLDPEGKPKVELLNPSSLNPSIRKQPPVLHYSTDDNRDEQLSTVHQQTHVFIQKAPKDAFLEVFSDGTSDSLATTTPTLNKANGFLEGLLPLPNRPYSDLYKMDAGRKTALKEGLQELTQLTLGTSIENADPKSPIVKDIKAALKSLAKNETGINDNQAVHTAFMALFKLDMEQSLEAIYSNPHLNELTSSNLSQKFEYGGSRKDAIRNVRVDGYQGQPGPITAGEMAQRKANLLHVLTEPLRQVQGPSYRLQASLDRSKTSEDNKFYLLDDNQENRTLVEDLRKSYEYSQQFPGQPEIDFTTVRTENGQIYLPTLVDRMRPKEVEEGLGVKVDDVSNAVIKS